MKIHPCPAEAMIVKQFTPRSYYATVASLKEYAKGMPKVTGFEETWRTLKEEQKDEVEKEHEAWAQGDWRTLSLEQQRIRKA